MTSEVSLRRPLRVDAVRNQERLLNAARSIFATKGLDAPLEDIARHAGVGIATLYRRFPDRESMIAAMFESKVRDMVELAHAATTAADPWDAFTTLLMSIFRIVANDKGLRQLLIGSRYGLKETMAERSTLIDLTGLVIRRAQDHGRLRREITENDIPPLVLMIGGVADFSSAINPALWERYATLLIDGLSNQEGQSGMRPNALSKSEMAVSMS